MIESSMAFATPQREDNIFKQWQSSMSASRTRIGGAATMRYDTNDRTAGPMPVFGHFLARDTVLTAGMANSLAPSSTTNAMVDAKADIAYEDTQGDSFEFGDVIDMINPLQHLPVVGMLYRKFTGDTIKPMAQIIGGAIFGGPVGAVSGTVNAVVQSTTGKDIGDNMISMISGEESFKAKAPTLTYQTPLSEDLLDGTTLAVANLSAPRDGRMNFSARSAYNAGRGNA